MADTEAAQVDRRDTSHFLEAMRLAEAGGNVANLAYMLAKYPPFDPTLDTEVANELARLTTIASSGLEFEREHGHGALLRLDHPWTASLIEAGLVPESRVSNVKRYAELVRVSG